MKLTHRILIAGLAGISILGATALARGGGMGGGAGAGAGGGMGQMARDGSAPGGMYGAASASMDGQGYGQKLQDGSAQGQMRGLSARGYSVSPDGTIVDADGNAVLDDQGNPVTQGSGYFRQ